MSRRRARCSSSSSSSSTARVARDELVLRVPVALDERAADEELARQHRVDRAVGDLAARDDRHPEQRRALGRDDRAALALPVRRLVGVLEQVPGERLDPRRLDLRGGAPPQPVGLHELGDHHPRRLPAREHGAVLDREARAAGALVLAAAHVVQPDVRQQARQQRDMDLLGLRRLLVERDADAARGLAQLARKILPLANAQVVQVLRPAALAELVARQLALLLAQVAPQVQEAR